MPKITSPIGFDGETSFGPLRVTFKQGVADVAELPGPIAVYLRQVGFTVDDDKPKRAPRAKAAED